MSLAALGVGLLGLVVGGIVGFWAGRSTSAAPVQPAPPPEPLPATPTPLPQLVDSPAQRAFDEALRWASEAGWSARLPAGADLQAQLVDDRAARAVMQLLERSARRDLRDLDSLFARQLAVERVWHAAAVLVAEGGYELQVDAPRAVGPRHQERWLIDTELRRSLRLADADSTIQPALVLRPVLLREGRVLLEGLVA